MTQTSSFSTLGISPEVLEAIEVLGFDTPSAIQEQAIPAAIGGSDIVGLSHTGSGKTLAFAIPALECIDPDERAVQVLALCPTRELAVQICREVDKLALFMDGVSAVPIYGGSSFRPQLDALRRGVQFVVGTPGRVMDLMESGALRLDHLRMLI
ncbi:MAG: DEAD/DEAH box helicase, partial [Akkermansia sp.]